MHTTRGSRRVGTAALFVGVAVVAAACGGGGSEAGSEFEGDATASVRAEGETLDVWIMEGTNPDAEPFFEDVSAAFTEQTGAELNVQFVPWGSAHDQFVTSIAGETTPDVAEVGTTWTPEFADAGALVDLSGQVEQAGLDGEYVDGLTEAGTYDEGLYGVPWYAGVRSIVYRTDLFEEAGVEPPTTWDELVEVGTTLKETHPDVVPFPVSTASFAWMPFVWGAGGDVATGEGEEWTSGLDTPEALEGTQFYTDLALEHGLSTPAASTWDEADLRDAFAQGEAAMIVSGSWTPGSIIEANPDLEGKLGAFPIPGPDGGLSPSFLGGSHLGVFQTADNPDLAWAFVRMMSTGEFAEQWGEESGFFPGTSALLEDIAAEEEPLVAPFATQMNEAGASVPVTPLWGQVEGAQILPAMLQSILSEQATAEEALDTAATEMNEIFGS
jgi:N,N'-diacetylchitobiose transport system substrate-binding protein